MQKQISPLLLTGVYLITLALIAYISYTCIRLIVNNLIPELMLPEDFFTDVPKSRFIMLKFFAIGISVFVVFTLFVFSQFIRNVKRGNIFTADNVRYLKRFSLMLMAFALLSILFRELNYWLIEIHLNFKDSEYVNHSAYVIASICLIFSLFFWIFANTYKVGLNLQQEKDLTI